MTISELRNIDVLSEMIWSTRLRNCLKLARIKTLGEIIDLIENGELDALRSDRGFGPKSINELYRNVVLYLASAGDPELYRKMWRKGY